MKIQSPPARAALATNPLAALPLFNLPPIVLPTDGRGKTKIERFAEFHAANPHVYEALRDMALKAKRAGIQRGGVKAMCEALRWSSIATRGEDWKINNDFTAFYARLLEKNNPDLRGFFEMRESVADVVVNSQQEQAETNAVPLRVAV